MDMYSSELVQNAIWAILVYAGLTLGQLFIVRLRLIRQVAMLLNLTFLFLAIHLFLIPYVTRAATWAASGAELIFFILLAYVGIRLADGLIFEVLIPRRKLKPVPVLVRDIFRWVLAAAAIFLILREVFPNLNLNFIAISSIVVGYILGNATQDTLGNLISGLALSSEKPFSIGDWVMVGGHTGQVVEMTWRATCLHTKSNDYILIPNSAIAREPIVNYSRPTRVHAIDSTIGVNYDVPPNKVRRVIVGVLDSVPEVLKDPPPSVFLSSYGDSAVNYTVKFFVTEFEQIERIQGHFFDLIWYHFRREDIEIPFPIRDVRIRRIGAGGRAAAYSAPDENAGILDGIDLFSPLSPDERAHLAANLREEIYARGEVLVRQGEPGGTFYIIKSGRVKVTAAKGDQEGDLARLGEGDYFGEMSLLTGERRNATVAAESDIHVLALSHDVLADLLEKNDSLSNELAGKLEERARQHKKVTDDLADETLFLAEPASRAELLTRIRQFLGLKK